MSNEAATADNKTRLGAISSEDADLIVKAVMAYAVCSDPEIPLTRDSLVGFTEGLIQSVVIVRSCS